MLFVPSEKQYIYWTFQAGQDKQNKPLLEWSRDVVNHYWHCVDISGSVKEFKVDFYGFK